jgi:hypothetical protein
MYSSSARSALDILPEAVYVRRYEAKSNPGNFARGPLRRVQR